MGAANADGRDRDGRHELIRAHDMRRQDRAGCEGQAGLGPHRGRRHHGEGDHEHADAHGCLLSGGYSALELRDALLRQYKKLTFFKLTEQAFVVGERFGFLVGSIEAFR